MRVLSTKQVGKIIGRSQGNVDKEILENRLKATKIAGVYIIEYEDLKEYCRVYRGAVC